MSTTFDTTFAAEAGPELFAEFGEQVTYIPRAGTQRQITAIIERGPLQPLEPIAEGLAIFARLKCFSDPATETYGGIDPADDFGGGAKIRMPKRKGGEPEPRTIGQHVKSVGGLTILEIW